MGHDRGKSIPPHRSRLARSPRSPPSGGRRGTPRRIRVVPFRDQHRSAAVRRHAVRRPFLSWSTMPRRDLNGTIVRPERDGEIRGRGRVVVEEPRDRVDAGHWSSMLTPRVAGRRGRGSLEPRRSTQADRPGGCLRHRRQAEGRPRSGHRGRRAAALGRTGDDRGVHVGLVRIAVDHVAPPRAPSQCRSSRSSRRNRWRSRPQGGRGIRRRSRRTNQSPPDALPIRLLLR